MEEHVGLNQMITPTRLQTFLNGLSDDANIPAHTVPADSADNHHSARTPVLTDIRPQDEVFRVDLQQSSGLRILIVHRMGREFVFLDIGSVTYSLGPVEQDELLRALEETNALGADLLDLKRINNRPRKVKGFTFTGRQLEILRLAARGETNIRISRTLSISISTVKRELRRVFDELNVSGRADAAAKAHQEAII